MSEPSLPDLLEALGELFLVPGSFDPARFEALGEASWTGLGITPALQGLLIKDRSNLDVAYTGLFLQGFDRPTLHLEASVQFTGSLADPELLAELAKIASIAGIHPAPSIQPDHLGALLLLQAHLFRELDRTRGDRALLLEAASKTLLQRFLQPLCERLRPGLEAPSTHPFYQTAGHLLCKTIFLSTAVMA
jgi:TorA maturation chaperone TorD